MDIPAEADIRDLRRYLSHRDMGPMVLMGEDSFVWGGLEQGENSGERAPDLIVIKGRSKEDAFSNWLIRWITDTALPRLIPTLRNKITKPYRQFDIRPYNHEILVRMTQYIISVVASILPIASIVLLYYIKSMNVRLGLIGLCNLIFSVCLVKFTKAKQIEIFSASAA
jgi:hypothetical protein